MPSTGLPTSEVCACTVCADGDYEAAIAAGLERASRGEVTLLGERIDAYDEDKLAKLRRGRVSMVFQSFHLLETMTAFDNVRAPLEIARLGEVNARAKAALEAVGLAERRLHYPGQLSGGERQRVAVARALACEPSLVFADEPTGNLDAASGAVVADLLFSITRKQGATLIIVTHDAELAAQHAALLHLQSQPSTPRARNHRGAVHVLPIVRRA
jgi:putative ABC transport system ATP-binding protein